MHDVDAFHSGVEACDAYLKDQARKPRNRCLVMAENARILAYGRYACAEAGPEASLRPCIYIDFVARDTGAAPGTGTDLMINLLVRIARDPKAAMAKGVLIDVIDCGNPEACTRRWRFFIELMGFRPLHDDGRPCGYAFMSMEQVREIAARAGA